MDCDGFSVCSDRERSQAKKVLQVVPRFGKLRRDSLILPANCSGRWKSRVIKHDQPIEAVADAVKLVVDASACLILCVVNFLPLRNSRHAAFSRVLRSHSGQ